MPVLHEERQDRIAQFNGIIGFHLKLWREQMGYTQKVLAELADMSSSQLARVELGERSLTFKQALVIKQILEISFEDLTDPVID